MLICSGGFQELSPDDLGKACHHLFARFRSLVMPRGFDYNFFVARVARPIPEPVAGGVGPRKGPSEGCPVPGDRRPAAGMRLCSS